MSGCECSTDDACCQNSCTPINENGTCADDSLACTTDTCAAGECMHAINDDACVIGGTCYAATAVKPSDNADGCLVCDPVQSQTGWSTKTGGTELACDGLDNDCDGSTDEDDAWPSPDAHETNNTSATAEDLTGNVNSTVTVTGLSFHQASDADYFRWQQVYTMNPQPFWKCRLENAAPGLKAHLTVGYQRSGDNLPKGSYYLSLACPLQGSGSWCAVPIISPTLGPDPYEFYAGVTPAEGVDECANAYELECVVSSTNN